MMIYGVFGVYLGDHANNKALLFNLVGLDSACILKNLAWKFVSRMKLQ
jgi:hypothetical protein